MNATAIFRQVTYYRHLRFDRKRIMYEMKRHLKKSWGPTKIALIDYIIENKKLPDKSPRQQAQQEAAVARMVQALDLRRKGKAWIGTQRCADLPELEQAGKKVQAKLVRLGFKRSIVRGDVGEWTTWFVPKAARGARLSVGVTAFGRRRPYRLGLEMILE